MQSNMQKLANTLKLPKIDDNGHKSQPYLNAAKDVLPVFQHTPKGETKYQRTSEALHTEGDAVFLGQKRGLSSDKAVKYSDAKEGSYFMNPSVKQSWILKKMEAQRETLQKKPQFLGLRETPQPDTYRQNAKGVRFNQPSGTVDPSDRGLVMKRKVSTEDSGVSKSVNFGAKLGRPGRVPQADSQDNLRKRLGQKYEENSYSEAHSRITPAPHERITPSDALFNSKSEKGKLSILSPLEERYNPDAEKGSGKVHFDLILRSEEKLYSMFESIENKASLIAHIKEYLELIEAEEVINVDALFYDTRMRRNLKTYLMLEKTAAFILLFLLTEDVSFPKETQEINIRNICHYMYSNFLNFAETISTKLEVLPKFSQIPPLEKLKQVVKKKVPEIDRSFGLEQVNKLLIKVLKTSFKNSNKKADHHTKVDLLLEKIEFGLMLNYFDELKDIFHDLIVRHRLNMQVKHPNDAGNSETAAPAKKTAKPEKPKLGTHAKTTPSDSPLKGASEKEYQLPPPVPKSGQEDKPIYTLVLDMDETLIHFEEVAGKGRFFVRPYAENFLKEMSELYEIVIFTAGVKDYADAVLNILDPNGYITHRLYRQHTTLNHHTPGVLKDLSKIGRDLTKTLIIDNAPDNFRLQIDNGLEIISWYNDPYDTELLDFTPFLKGLVEKNVDDVRKAIRKYKEKKRHNKRH